MTTRGLDDVIENAPDMGWLAEAGCADLPLDELEQFFVEAGRSISTQTVARCRACPVRVDCLDHAYAHQIANGYFGGMSPSKRRTTSHGEARRLVAQPAPGETR